MGTVINVLVAVCVCIAVCFITCATVPDHAKIWPWPKDIESI